MDIVFTYSRFNMETFTDAGVNRPIIIIPHGVDVERFHPAAQPMDTPKDRFIFGVNCEWTERKNIRNLIRAYYRAFEGNKDVLLLIKTYHQFPIHQSVQKIRGEVAKLKAEFPKGFKHPDIALITEILSEKDMPGFYTAIDCYVMPTRGEGWSLTFTEAMASGLPVIAPNWSGHTEFMNHDNSYLLDCELVNIRNSEVVNQPHYAGHKWADVKVDHLAEIMKMVYGNQTVAAIRGVQARKDMVEKWTWDMACRKLKDQLEVLV
jgi:glycosyltransferase involved in cell wall biosynthesis